MIKVFIIKGVRSRVSASRSIVGLSYEIKPPNLTFSTLPSTLAKFVDKSKSCMVKWVSSIKIARIFLKFTNKSFYVEHSTPLVRSAVHVRTQVFLSQCEPLDFVNEAIGQNLLIEASQVHIFECHVLHYPVSFFNSIKQALELVIGQSWNIVVGPKVLIYDGPCFEVKVVDVKCFDGNF